MSAGEGDGGAREYERLAGIIDSIAEAIEEEVKRNAERARTSPDSQSAALYRMEERDARAEASDYRRIAEIVRRAREAPDA